jgi:hypothetical protein
MLVYQRVSTNMQNWSGVSIDPRWTSNCPQEVNQLQDRRKEVTKALNVALTIHVAVDQIGYPEIRVLNDA